MKPKLYNNKIEKTTLNLFFIPLIIPLFEITKLEKIAIIIPPIHHKRKLNTSRFRTHI